MDDLSLEDPTASLGRTLSAGLENSGALESGYAEPIYGPNDLWLEITNVSNGQAYLNLHHATDQVYEVWSKTDLLAAHWDIEQEVWPESDQDPAAFTVPLLGRTNLFIWARDWTGIDENNNGIADWWEWKYFGNFNQPIDGDYDSDGVDNLTEYQLGTDPNKILFSFKFPNERVNTGMAQGTITVLGGVPSGMALLLNNSNFPSATWQPFDSNVIVPLDSGDGTYDVWIGLRGLPSDARQTWQWAQLVLDTLSPAITVTNPTIGTVSSPIIQVQGYASEPLSQITVDVNSSAGNVSNQPGFLAGQYYDANLQAFTTNWFQCYDVGLSDGLNTITLHATDLAGNTTTASFNVTLDYSGDTTPPLLTLVWPQDGMSIGGDTFTLRGVVDDRTTRVTISGLAAGPQDAFVQRDGQFWAANLSLTDGDNVLTVTATDAAGDSTTVNITVFKSDVTLVINPVSPDELKQRTATVYGTISDASYDVWVNGVEAVVDGDGNWEADNVPVYGNGIAALDAVAYPPAQTSTPRMSFTASPMDAGGGSEVDQSQVEVMPSLVRVTSYQENLQRESTVISCNVPSTATETRTIAWANGVGGYSSQHSIGSEYSGYIPLECNSYVIWPTNWPDGQVLNGESCEGDYSELEAPAWQYCSLQDQSTGYSIVGDCGPTSRIIDSENLSRTAQTRIELAVGGQVLTKTQQIILLTASVSEYSDLAVNLSSPAQAWLQNTYLYGAGDVPLPASAMRILGRTPIPAATDDTVGYLILTLPAGAVQDITPTIVYPLNQTYYSFDVQATDLNLQLAVDNNRDGQITFANNDAATPTKPFWFWVNDSQEKGDIVSGAEDQIPGQSPVNANYNQSHIQGRSDLVNYFPVVLSLSNVLQWLPPTDGFEYHLVQNDGAVKFVYTSLTPTNAFDYLTNTVSAGYGINANETADAADTVGPVSIVPGVTLDANWLAQVQANGGTGIILVEGCATTTQPLWLEIWKDNKLLGGVPMYLSISEVEDMYRHKNLRDGADAPSGLAGDLTVRDSDLSVMTQMGEPEKYPDSLSNSRWFIFVVGSDVGGQNARGWESEVFKRMYWSGNKAKFVGVAWYGDPYGGDIDVLYDYHMAVRNAFATAPTLASFINGLSGRKTIVGHSLGNGMIASALSDYGMNVNNVCMMDAAFAQECFDGDAGDDLTAMQPAAWQGYDSRLFAAHWHERFDASDARSTLTWRNRFVGALNTGANIYNFYSSTEDVLGEYDGTPTSALVQNAFLAITGGIIALEAYAWTIQEKCKGDKIDVIVAHGGSDYGGWGFNVMDGYLASYPIWYVPYPCNCARRAKTPAEIGTVTQDMLDGSKYNPLFKTGWGAFDANNAAAVYVNNDVAYFAGPSWILGLYQSGSGNTIASDPAKRAQLLAEAIPALSKPVGANPCQNNALSGKQFDMAAQFADAAHWPRTIPVGLLPPWLHSDMDNIAYPLIHGLYDRLVSISN